MNRNSLEEPDYNSSKFWAFRSLVLPMFKFFNGRQTEEWIGDLEEAMWEMEKLKLSYWHINLNILCRALPLVRSLIHFQKRNWLSVIANLAIQYLNIKLEKATTEVFEEAKNRIEWAKKWS